MTRFNKFLLGLLAVQVVLMVLMLSRGEPTAPAKAVPVLAGFDAAKVDKLTIWGERDGAPAAGSGSDASASADKPAIELVKDATGWVVANYHRYPVKDDKITDLLSKLSAMKASAPIATGVTRQQQLGVTADKYQRKLVLGAGGKDTTVLLGEPVGRGTAVRVGDDKRVFGISGLTSWSVGAGILQWIDTTYLDLPASDIGRVTVARGADTLELVRTDGGWQVLQNGIAVVPGAGEQVDGAEIDRRVGQIAKVYLSAPADPARDVSAPMATVSVWKQAAAPAPVDPAGAGSGSGGGAGSGSGAGSITVGLPALVVDVLADADGKTYWLKERGKTTAITIDASRVKDLIEVTRAAVVKVPSAPAPAPAAPPGGMQLPPGLPPGLMPQ